MKKIPDKTQITFVAGGRDYAATRDGDEWEIGDWYPETNVVADTEWYATIDDFIKALIEGGWEL